MAELTELLEKEGVDKELLAGAERFRKAYPADPAFADRIPKVSALYYGKTVWEEAVAVLLSGRNLLLAGPKATGKNLLCENLAALFGRPVWNVSFHIGTDAAGLIGTDTFDGEKVSFRKGPVCMSAEKADSASWTRSTWPGTSLWPSFMRHWTTGGSLTCRAMI